MTSPENKIIDDLWMQLHRVIDEYRGENHLPYASILGVLDLVKDDILEECRGAKDDSDKNE